MAQLRVDKAALILEGLVERQDVRPGTLIPEGVASIRSQGVAVTVRVLRGYRGVFPEALTVLTEMGNGDCGIEFETGQPYLIFANLLDSGQTFTSICAGTEVLSRSEPAVRLLRGEPPVPDDLLSLKDYYVEMVPLWTGSVRGRVTNALDGSPVCGADVTAWQPSDGPFHRKNLNASGTDSSFCVVADPGQYLLTAERDDLNAGARLNGFLSGSFQAFGGCRHHCEVRNKDIRACLRS
jgi:hypothetical protein